MSAQTSSSSGNNESKFLDFLVEEICAQPEVSGFVRAVSEQAIGSLVASGDHTARDASMFTDIVVEKICNALVEMTGSGHIPSSIVALLRALHLADGRLSPQDALCEHLVPRMVQVIPLAINYFLYRDLSRTHINTCYR